MSDNGLPTRRVRGFRRGPASLPRCGGLALVASLTLLAAACEPGEPRSGEARERAFSVQLHVHGSFSEGVGSIDSHSHEARDVGVDVIWWSDHDFRIASYRHVTRFGFEDWHEPVDRSEAWRDLLPRRREGGGEKGLEPTDRQLEDGSAEFVVGGAHEGERSLRVRAGGAGPSGPGGAPAANLYEFRSSRRVMPESSGRRCSPRLERNS